MCFNYSLTKKAEYIEKRFKVKFNEMDIYNPFFHANAFDLPVLPVIASNDAKHVQFMQWGLIPFWVKDKKTAESIRMNTFNARSETITSLPSFKTSIKNKRCLVISDGFFEWHEYNGKKYPFYIKLKNNEAFAMAGLFDQWDDKEGSVLNTFSIITTPANPMLEKIHNIKKRMPAILKSEHESAWIENNTDIYEILKMIIPYNDSEMESHTVSKLIINKGINTNVSQAIEFFKYSELDESF